LLPAYFLYYFLWKNHISPAGQPFRLADRTYTAEKLHKGGHA